LSGLHHPAAAAAGQRHGLPARLFASDSVSTAASSELTQHRRRLALDAHRSTLQQVLGERRLSRSPGHVAASTHTGQLEHHAVPAASVYHHHRHQHHHHLVLGTQTVSNSM